jgi:hypothetical protein
LLAFGAGVVALLLLVWLATSTNQPAQKREGDREGAGGGNGVTKPNEVTVRGHVTGGGIAADDALFDVMGHMADNINWDGGERVKQDRQGKQAKKLT